MSNKVITIQVNEDGKSVFTTESPAEALMYTQMRSFNELTHGDALLAVGVGMEMYLKDSNSTPLGHLSDYVGKHFERLSKMDSRWHMLEDFYNNYESEDYEIVNQYTE